MSESHCDDLDSEGNSLLRAIRVMFMAAMDVTPILSKQNATLKRVRAALLGKEEGVVVLEGLRLVRDAVRSGQRLELLLVECRHAEELADLEPQVDEWKLVGDGLLASVGDLTSGPGVVALCRTPQAALLEDLTLNPSTRLLAIDGIADPGNLGALARAAEALGVTALLVVRGSARPWSPKALRGSMGSLLRLPVVLFESAEPLAGELRRLGIRQVVALTRGGQSPDEYAWTGPLALWVSGETGQSSAVDYGADGVDAITIPMLGEAESLNVTVAAALLLDAARRGVHR